MPKMNVLLQKISGFILSNCIDEKRHTFFGFGAFWESAKVILSKSCVELFSIYLIHIHLGFNFKELKVYETKLYICYSIFALFKCDVLAIALLRIENSTSFLSLSQDLDKNQNFDKQVNSNVNKEFLPKKSSPEFWSNSNKNIIKNSVVI